ncbi:hypothetical protein PL75_06810 [Neisseria arctica]|uniref:Uncharacterized protein n=1 Tax=Neisseria arctica TaxID=1470200 RepID=A0A0J0YRN5_9NEIS|nr:hypothetical protein [Neisseria arctica]KLT72780.1 hypothetical protein PL75_06810 [Neisseria arctica]UOO87279.1 hypothetical protein LVJ86_03225 [Neisseria arctica]
MHYKKNNKLKKWLLFFLITISTNIYAQVYIINNQTLDPSDWDTSSTSLSDIDNNKFILLQYYNYAERKKIAETKQQNLNELSNEILNLNNSNIDLEIANIQEQLSTMKKESEEAIKFLSTYTLPELKQLNQLEQDNLQKIILLQEQINSFTHK